MTLFKLFCQKKVSTCLDDNSQVPREVVTRCRCRSVQRCCRTLLQIKSPISCHDFLLLERRKLTEVLNNVRRTVIPQREYHSIKVRDNFDWCVYYFEAFKGGAVLADCHEPITS